MSLNENIPASPKIDAPIDMIEYARETTRRDLQRAKPGSIKLVAPAKVNLFLGVGNRRSDGYHEVDNVLHALMLHDVLYMNVEPADISADTPVGIVDEDNAYENPLSISVQMVGFEGVEVPNIAPEENIAYRAVAALAQALGRTQREHVHIRIEKHIPHQAGLGGGSADAAAALVGAAHLWGVDGIENTPIIEKVARNLGADVAFFLRGGCAFYASRGDIFQRAFAARKDNVVIIKPEGGLSTSAVYGEFDESHNAVSPDDIQRIAGVAVAADIPLFNNLADPAQRLMPELSRVRDWASQQPGTSEVLLCGSGAATFVICENFNTACKIVAAAKLQGWWARSTMFCGAKAMLSRS